MKFIAVEFNSDLREFAVLPVDKILDGNLRALKNDVVGRKTSVLWGKKEFLVTIRGYGTKASMERLCDNLAEEAAEESDNGMDVANHSASQPTRTPSSCRDGIIDVLAKRQKMGENDLTTAAENPQAVTFQRSSDDTDHGGVNPEDIVQTVEDLQSEEINKLKKKIEKLKASVNKHKERAKQLKNQNLELKNQANLANSDDTMELTAESGVYLLKSDVAAAKLTSKTPPILARNLFRQAFQMEDLKGHSLFGRQCNANKRNESLPSVDCVKRDAIIEFSLLAFKLHPSSNIGSRKGICEYSVQKKKIVDSLNKLLREVNGRD